MQSKTFGKLGWPVSAVGLGTWNIGNQWGDIDDATAWTTIRAAYEHGITLFDTAESYGIPHGLSEMRLGTALAGIRQNVYIVSKIGSWGNRTGAAVPKIGIDSIRLSGHAILGRLRTDYVDVVLCHEGNLDDPTVYLEGFEALKAEGAIRAYGISTNDVEVLKRFNVNGTCSVAQTDYSLLNLAAESDFFPYCQEHGIAVMVRGPLARGLLSGRYTKESTFNDSVRTSWNNEGPARDKFLQQVAQVQKLAGVVEPGLDLVRAAIAYSFGHPAISVTIPGAKSAEQARVNAAAGEGLLTDAERKMLVNAVS
jgi:aryl-alcohol dehydrogenase-like predicted oxidoreductase